jgi:hypothetical protein
VTSADHVGAAADTSAVTPLSTTPAGGVTDVASSQHSPTTVGDGVRAGGASGASSATESYEFVDAVVAALPVAAAVTATAATTTSTTAKPLGDVDVDDIDALESYLDNL